MTIMTKPGQNLGKMTTLNIRINTNTLTALNATKEGLLLIPRLSSRRIGHGSHSITAVFIGAARADLHCPVLRPRRSEREPGEIRGPRQPQAQAYPAVGPSEGFRRHRSGGVSGSGRHGKAERARVRRRWSSEAETRDRRYRVLLDYAFTILLTFLN